MHYAVIGFGCAGYYAAKTIRENDPDGIITVFSEHNYSPYNPMLTTYFAAGKIPFESLFPFGSLKQIEEEYRLDIRTGTKVKAVHAAEQQIVLEDGETVGYDRLLIASGASAFAPVFDGLDPADAFYMRTVDDAVRLKNELEEKPHRSALVVGASMVGIKVVELLNGQGIHTVLADLAPAIFPLASYPDVAAEIERRISAKGVELALGKGLQKAEKTKSGYHCTMSDGSTVDADLIVLCIGTRANTKIVDPNEIKINRGIVVDDAMATSWPGVYAAGDCCEGHELQSRNTMIIGLWANAAHQGTTAGANMTGKAAEFDGNFLHNITHFMDMDFIGFGDNRITGEVLTSGNIHEGLYVEAVLKDHRLAGVNILDNYRISGAIKNYLYRMMEGESEEISPIQKGILIKEGLRPSFIEKLEGSYHDKG
ncbi:MAG: FAD-dependent oxidoreductase [Solobacterium sp.]|nr:FAD-dependent oxidoreductase [Solobacterium sp.]MBR3127863.1 FAD-dependent oxidoreductase [Solobacterium sp.]